MTNTEVNWDRDSADRAEVAEVVALIKQIEERDPQAGAELRREISESARRLMEEVRQ